MSVCARGLAELSAFLQEVGEFRFRVDYADTIGGDDLKQNLITLGGPDANEISKRVLSDVNHHIRSGDSSKYEISFSDSMTGDHYSPDISPASEDGTDYSFVVKARNPYQKDSSVIVVVGCFGYGTWGGVRSLLSEDFFQSEIVESNSTFEMIICSKVRKGVPVENKILVLRKL